MTTSRKTAGEADATAERAALRPAGPQPSQPQGAPGGSVQIGETYVEPLASAAMVDGQVKRPAPFAFRDGVLLAQGAVQVVPQDS